jgi:hypothetical protein
MMPRHDLSVTRQAVVAGGADTGGVGSGDTGFAWPRPMAHVAKRQSTEKLGRNAARSLTGGPEQCGAILALAGRIRFVGPTR